MAATPGGDVSADGGAPGARLTVLPVDDDADVGCAGPLERLTAAGDALLELRLADAAGELSRGSFDRGLECWPLWAFLLAIFWLGWLRS